MLRLPPTVIGLARSDIQDHDKRRQFSHCKDKHLLNKTLRNTVTTIPRHLTLAYRPLPKNAIDLLYSQRLSSNGLLHISEDKSNLQCHGPSISSSLHAYNIQTPEDIYLVNELRSRIVSRVVDNESSGLLFSQIPRAKERSTIVPRHQENSYLINSSGYIIEACERSRDSSSSASDLLFSSSNLIDINEESYSNYLQSPEHLTKTKLALQDPRNEKNYTQNSTFSACLNLPPPFSVKSRRVSAVESIPSTPQPIHLEGKFMSTNSHQNTNEPNQIEGNEISAKILDPQLITPGLSPNYSPQQKHLDDFEKIGEDQIYLKQKTPSEPYRVYNDEIPPELQPQTPANLPESRHRSRYHSSFTAPDFQFHRRNSPSDVFNGMDTLGPQQMTPVASYVPNVREISPAGLSLHNLASLYRGRRISIDSQNWIEDLRLDSSYVRLWRSDCTDHTASDDRVLE